jgi:hypothetical protein
LRQGFAPPVDLIPASLSERLSQNIYVSSRKFCLAEDASDDEDWVILSSEESVPVDDIKKRVNKKNSLFIVLVDSPLHRLLTHAIVQFHGLHSQV